MNEVKKYCAECKTTRTPLWRSGPHGPRSLCNACGIRYRKRKTANEFPSQETKTDVLLSRSIRSDDQQMNDTISMRCDAASYSDLGKEVILQRNESSSSSSSSSSLLKKQRSSRGSSMNSNSSRSLGEVELAAVLLMSLSCSSVFA